MPLSYIQHIFFQLLICVFILLMAFFWQNKNFNLYLVNFIQLFVIFLFLLSCTPKLFFALLFMFTVLVLLDLQVKSPSSHLATHPITSVKRRAEVKGRKGTSTSTDKEVQNLSLSFQKFWAFSKREQRHGLGFIQLATQVILVTAVTQSIAGSRLVPSRTMIVRGYSSVLKGSCFGD